MAIEQDNHAYLSPQYINHRLEFGNKIIVGRSANSDDMMY